MSRLIKAAAADEVVRTFVAASPHHHDYTIAAAPARSQTELALEEARDEITKLQNALIAARALAEQGRKEALETGRAEGRRAAEDDMARRRGLIEKGIGRAETAWHEKIGGLDTLAAMLARSALASVFGNSTDLTDLVTRAIALRVRGIRRESIVGIRVSPEDFPDTDALDALRTEAGTRSIDIVADAAFSRGECRFDLKLGHIDLGIQSQWRELERFLETLAVDRAV